MPSALLQEPYISRLQLRSLSQFSSPFLSHCPFTLKFKRFSQTNTLISPMASAKRPTCPSCSKPATVCLCSRLRSPPLQNSVAVTIFQHTLEKNHPLNSARIARIGLQNVDIVTVSDVHFEARFSIRLLDSNLEHKLGLNEIEISGARHVFDEMPPELCAFDLTIARCGNVPSVSNCKIGSDEVQEMSFDQLLGNGVALNEIRKGFVVKKMKVKEESEECKEFEIVVPPGSVLLFPSKGSVDVEAIDYEVKNMIVLDGTWAKARRMYMENPWLRLLPHIRLNLDKLSLYSEVRVQPRAGYLSTIESIVYTMKAVGIEEEEGEGLDGLLEVFEAMVGDQRRCKDERMSKLHATIG